MKYQHLQTKRARLWRLFITLGLLAVGVWLLAASWHTFRSGFTAVSQAQPGWLVLALLLTVLTFCIAAAIYRLLALKTVRYAQLLLVEVAASFANRLLPAGLGGLGLHGLYLHRRGHTPAQVTAVVSVNNLLGVTAHLALLASVICFESALLRRFTAHVSGFRWWYVAVVVAVVVVILALARVRRKVRQFGSNLLKSFRSLRAARLLSAFILALLLTSTYTLVLYSSAQAVGSYLGLLQVFIVFSLGMLVGTATPTPGGLVGVEAGLYAGFIGCGLSAAHAAGAVIIFRLLTYWLPLTPGVVALLFARRMRLV